MKKRLQKKKSTSLHFMMKTTPLQGRTFAWSAGTRKMKEISFHTGRRKISPKKPEAVQRYANIDVFYDLFNKLENENDVSRVNFRYVLSLYLMRKKGAETKDFTQVQWE